MHWNNSEGDSEDNIDMVVDEDEVMCVDWSSIYVSLTIANSLVLAALIPTFESSANLHDDEVMCVTWSGWCIISETASAGIAFSQSKAFHKCESAPYDNC